MFVTGNEVEERYLPLGRSSKSRRRDSLKNGVLVDTRCLSRYLDR